MYQEGTSMAQDTSVNPSSEGYSTSSFSDSTTLPTNATIASTAAVTNSTIPSDADTEIPIVLYVAIPAGILTLVEVLIFVVLLKRCCSCKNSNWEKLGRTNFADEDAERYPVLGVVNRGYTGFEAGEDDTDATENNGERSIRITGEVVPSNVKISRCPETKYTGYVDVEITQKASTENECSKKFPIEKGTECFNKTYSHIEGSPKLPPRAKATSSYAHVDLGDSVDTYNKLQIKRDSDSIGKAEPNNEEDVEYDHTFSRKSCQRRGDNNVYSHLSSVIPETGATLRPKEPRNMNRERRPNKWYEYTELTNLRLDSNKDSLEFHHNIEVPQNQQTLSVNKTDVEADRDPGETLGAKKNGQKTQKSRREYTYSQVIKNKKTNIKDIDGKNSRDITPDGSFQIVSDENLSKCTGDSKTSKDTTKTSRETERYAEQMPKPDEMNTRSLRSTKTNAYSQVIKKAQADRDGQRLFKIEDEEISDMFGKMKSNEYENVLLV